VALNTVPLTDAFNTNLLTFLSAAPPPDSTNTPGSLVWTNVGPLLVGGSTVITAQFTVATSGTGTNTATASPMTNATPVLPVTAYVTHRTVDPRVSVTKTVVSPTNRPAATGETMIFRIAVTNVGDIALDTVPLTDTFNTNMLTFSSATPALSTNSGNVLTWNNIGPLAIGSSRVITSQFTVVSSGQGTNVATSTPSTTNGIPVPVVSTNVTHTSFSPGIKVTKTLVSPASRPAAIGETMTFWIAVTNTGNLTLDNVPLTDTFNTNMLTFSSATPALSTNSGNVLTWNNIGPLAIGGSRVITSQFTVVSSGLGTNVATSTPSTTNGVPVPSVTTNVTHTSVNPRIKVTKTLVSPAGRPAAVGETMTFWIAVTNTGNLMLDSVLLTDTFNTNLLTFSSATPALNTNSGNVLTWNDIGPLAIGGSRVITSQFTVASSGLGTNVASASPITTNNVPVPVVTTNVTHISVSPGIKVTKTLVSPAGRPAAVGETMTFWIAVTNTGNLTLDTVPLTDTFNTNLLTFSSATPALNTNSGNVLTWNNIGPLAIGGSRVITSQFTVVSSGQGTNVASASPRTTNSVPVPVMTTNVTHISVSPGINVTNTLISPAGRPANVGEALTFLIAVMNTGNVTLDTVPVTNTYDPTLLQYSSAVPQPTSTNIPGTLSWTNIGSLMPGTTGMVTVTMQANGSTAGLLAGTNTAVSSPSTTNGVPVVPQTTNLLYSTDWMTLTVVSAYGNPVLGRGVWTNLYGAALTNSVTSPVPDGTMTQYVNLGWTMTGNDPQLGYTNSMLMNQTNSAVLTWQWKTQYSLIAGSDLHGQVSATNGWWDAGSTTVVSAASDVYYMFSQWTGTMSSTNNPLIVMMNQAHSLVGLFAANLATNGVPQAWLASYGLTNRTWDEEAMDDQDKDKMPTWQEWIADTVPTNPKSCLAFTAINYQGSGAIPQWQGGVMATQYIEWADHLTGTQIQWHVVYTNLPPTPIFTNCFDQSGTNSRRLYRIRAGK